MKNIVNLIDGIPFDKFYFEVAILLPNILFVSSEVWYNLTNSELDLLETVDVNLLREILKAPKSTPKEMLFLELGILHLREMGTVPPNNFLFGRTVPPNNFLFGGTCPPQPKHHT